MPELALHLVAPRADLLREGRGRYCVSTRWLRRRPQRLYLHERAGELSYFAGDVTDWQRDDWSTTLRAGALAEQRPWPLAKYRSYCYHRLEESEVSDVGWEDCSRERPQLYVMAYEGDDSCCRIGCAVDPPALAAELSRSHAYGVRVVHSWWDAAADAEEAVYAALAEHVVYRDGAITGWFWLSPVEGVAAVARLVA